MAFEKFIHPENEGDPKMPTHGLFSIFTEYIAGQKTEAEGLALIECVLGQTLTTDEKADIEGIYNAIDAAPDTSTKLHIVVPLYGVCLNAEINSCEWYDTQAKIKARFNWS